LHDLVFRRIRFQGGLDRGDAETPACSMTVLRGDCVEVMKAMPSKSVDFIPTDPPYLVRYVDRSGRSVKNDDNDAWIDPAFVQMYRVLKDNRFCLSFYAWNKVDRFVDAWKKAGFHIARPYRLHEEIRLLRALHALPA
jgi:DNA modification methylase